MIRAIALFSVRGAAGRELLALAALLAGAAAVLLAMVSAQGFTREITEKAPFVERGTFDYAATLGRDVYDDNQLRPPQPLFRRLGERLPVRFQYEVDGVLPIHHIDGARGSYALTIEVRHGNGWMRTIPAVPRASFEGTSFEADGVIDLVHLSDIVRRMEAETGLKPSPVRVRIVADVAMEGTLLGVDIGRPYQQVIEFSLSDLELRLEAGPSKVEQSVGGEVQYEVVEPRSMAVPVLGTRIQYVRIPGFARGTLLAAGALVVLVTLATLLSFRRPVTAELPSKYERVVTDVGHVDGGGAGARVVVADLEALFHLATQYQLPVLRTHEVGGTVYWLLAETTYVFDSRPGETIRHQASGPAPPGPGWRSAAPLDPIRFATAPSSPPGREGRAAYPRHGWSALMTAGTDHEAGTAGSLGLGVSRGRLGVDEVLRADVPAVSDLGEGLLGGRSYWGAIWPQYDDDSAKEDAA